MGCKILHFNTRPGPFLQPLISLKSRHQIHIEMKDDAPHKRQVRERDEYVELAGIPLIFKTSPKVPLCSALVSLNNEMFMAERRTSSGSNV